MNIQALGLAERERVCVCTWSRLNIQALGLGERERVCVCTWSRLNIQALGLASSQLLLERLVTLRLLRRFHVFDLLQLLPSLPFRT